MSDPHIVYAPIYSDFGRIQNRVPQIDTNMTSQIEAYLQYIDQLIDNTLRSVLGNRDKNGFYISLPLNGNNDIIDIQKMIIQLRQDIEIGMRADNCVIGQYRSDTAENDEKMEKAEARLIETIYTKFGRAISSPTDFTTDYLKTLKRVLENGVIRALEGQRGVRLLGNTNFNRFNGSNPDSRVIFVPVTTF
jgi:hypothetical protein